MVLPPQLSSISRQYLLHFTLPESLYDYLFHNTTVMFSERPSSEVGTIFLLCVNPYYFRCIEKTKFCKSSKPSFIDSFICLNDQPGYKKEPNNSSRKIQHGTTYISIKSFFFFEKTLPINGMRKEICGLLKVNRPA